MSTLAPAKLASQYRLSAMINGGLGIVSIFAALGFALVWLVAGLYFHQMVSLISLLATGASFLGTAAVLLSVAAYHFFKWRETKA